jgi:uncharacterized protein (TIRG00374 family)
MPDVLKTKNHSTQQSILVRWWFKLLVSIVLLWFILRQVDFSIVFNTLRLVHPGFLCLSIFTFFPVQLITAYRWFILLNRMDCGQSYGRVLRMSLLGQFSALFLPSQISGDVVRFLNMARGAHYSERIALTVVVDKLAILAAIASFPSIIGIMKSPLSKYVSVYVLSLGLLIFSLGSILVLGRYRSEKLRLVIPTLLAHWPSSIRSKLTIFTQEEIPRLTYQAIGVNILLGYSCQLFNIIGSYLMALSMNIKVPLLEWAGIQSIVSIVQVLPISFGGLGVREGTFVLLLSLYMIPSSKTLAYSLTGFLFTTLLLTFSWLAAEFLEQHRLKIYGSTSTEIVPGKPGQVDGKVD